MRRLATVDEGTRLACLTKAQVLIVQELSRGETVMQLDQIEIRYPDACGFVGQLRRRPRER